LTDADGGGANTTWITWRTTHRCFTAQRKSLQWQVGDLIKALAGFNPNFTKQFQNTIQQTMRLAHRLLGKVDEIFCSIKRDNAATGEVQVAGQ